MTLSKRATALLFSFLVGVLGSFFFSATSSHASNRHASNRHASNSVVAQTRLSPKPTVYPASNELRSTPTNPDIYFMIAGPMGSYYSDGLDPTRWRLALSCAEVYCGITFDYIEIQQEYEGLPRIVSSYWLNGADIAPLLDTDSDFLHDIDFVAWEAWDRVIMKEGDRPFRININPDQTFTITPL